MAKEPIIKHLRSKTAGKTPTDLLEGRLFINIPDKKLYFGNAADKPEDLSELPAYTAGNADQLLAVNAAGDDVEWVDATEAAIVNGGAISDIKDDPADPTTPLVHTVPTIYTVTTGGKAHANYQELSGMDIPDGSILMWLTGNHWVWLDQLSKLINDLLPSYVVADAAKVLSVDTAGTGVEWVELPTVTPRFIDGGTDTTAPTPDVWTKFNGGGYTVDDHDLIIYRYNGNAYLYTGDSGTITTSTTADFHMLSSDIPDADDTDRGIARLATNDEVRDGANPTPSTDTIVTPERLMNAMGIIKWQTGANSVVGRVYENGGKLWESIKPVATAPVAGDDWKEVNPPAIKPVDFATNPAVEVGKIVFDTNSVNGGEAYFGYDNGGTPVWVPLVDLDKAIANAIVNNPTADQNIAGAHKLTLNSDKIELDGSTGDVTAKGTVEASDFKSTATTGTALEVNTDKFTVAADTGDVTSKGKATAKQVEIDASNLPNATDIALSVDDGGAKFSVDKSGHVRVNGAPSLALAALNVQMNTNRYGYYGQTNGATISNSAVFEAEVNSTTVKASGFNSALYNTAAAGSQAFFGSTPHDLTGKDLYWHQCKDALGDRFYVKGDGSAMFAGVIDPQKGIKGRDAFPDPGLVGEVKDQTATVSGNLSITGGTQNTTSFTAYAGVWSYSVRILIPAASTVVCPLRCVFYGVRTSVFALPASQSAKYVFLFSTTIQKSSDTPVDLVISGLDTGKTTDITGYSVTVQATRIA